MKNFQNTQTKAKSTDRKSPVSKKFYTYISERVTAACAMTAHSEAMAADWVTLPKMVVDIV